MTRSPASPNGSSLAYSQTGGPTKAELLTWVNNVLDLKLTKIEQLGTGAVFCQLLDAVVPECVPIAKVNFHGKEEHEVLPNWKLCTAALSKAGLAMANRDWDVARLSRGSPAENLELLQWMYKQLAGHAILPGYQPAARRAMSVRKGTADIPLPAACSTGIFNAYARTPVSPSAGKSPYQPSSYGRVNVSGVHSKFKAGLVQPCLMPGPRKYAAVPCIGGGSELPPRDVSEDEAVDVLPTRNSQQDAWTQSMPASLQPEMVAHEVQTNAQWADADIGIDAVAAQTSGALPTAQARVSEASAPLTEDLNDTMYSTPGLRSHRVTHEFDNPYYCSRATGTSGGTWSREVTQDTLQHYQRDSLDADAAQVFMKEGLLAEEEDAWAGVLAPKRLPQDDAQAAAMSQLNKQQPPSGSFTPQNAAGWNITVPDELLPGTLDAPLGQQVLSPQSSLLEGGASTSHVPASSGSSCAEPLAQSSSMTLDTLGHASWGTAALTAASNQPSALGGQGVAAAERSWEPVSCGGSSQASQGVSQQQHMQNWQLTAAHSHAAFDSVGHAIDAPSSFRTSGTNQPTHLFSAVTGDDSTGERGLSAQFVPLPSGPDFSHAYVLGPKVFASDGGGFFVPTSPSGDNAPEACEFTDYSTHGRRHTTSAHPATESGHHPTHMEHDSQAILIHHSLVIDGTSFGTGPLLAGGSTDIALGLSQGFSAATQSVQHCEWEGMPADGREPCSSGASSQCHAAATHMLRQAVAELSRSSGSFASQAGKRHSVDGQGHPPVHMTGRQEQIGGTELAGCSGTASDGGAADQQPADMDSDVLTEPDDDGYQFYGEHKQQQDSQAGFKNEHSSTPQWRIVDVNHDEEQAEGHSNMVVRSSRHLHSTPGATEATGAAGGLQSLGLNPLAAGAESAVQQNVVQLVVSTLPSEDSSAEASMDDGELTNPAADNAFDDQGSISSSHASTVHHDADQSCGYASTSASADGRTGTEATQLLGDQGAAVVAQQQLQVAADAAEQLLQAVFERTPIGPNSAQEQLLGAQDATPSHEGSGEHTEQQLSVAVHAADQLLRAVAEADTAKATHVTAHEQQLPSTGLAGDQLSSTEFASQELLSEAQVSKQQEYEDAGADIELAATNEAAQEPAEATSQTLEAIAGGSEVQLPGHAPAEAASSGPLNCVGTASAAAHGDDTSAVEVHGGVDALTSTLHALTNNPPSQANFPVYAGTQSATGNPAAAAAGLPLVALPVQQQAGQGVFTHMADNTSTAAGTALQDDLCPKSPPHTKAFDASEEQAQHSSTAAGGQHWQPVQGADVHGGDHSTSDSLDAVSIAADEHLSGSAAYAVDAHGHSLLDKTTGVAVGSSAQPIATQSHQTEEHLPTEVALQQPRVGTRASEEPPEAVVGDDSSHVTSHAEKVVDATLQGMITVAKQSPAAGVHGPHVGVKKMSPLPAHCSDVSPASMASDAMQLYSTAEVLQEQQCLADAGQYASIQQRASRAGGCGQQSGTSHVSARTCVGGQELPKREQLSVLSPDAVGIDGQLNAAVTSKADEQRLDAAVAAEQPLIVAAGTEHQLLNNAEGAGAMGAQASPNEQPPAASPATLQTLGMLQSEAAGSAIAMELPLVATDHHLQQPRPAAREVAGPSEAQQHHAVDKEQLQLIEAESSQGSSHGFAAWPAGKAAASPDDMARATLCAQQRGVPATVGELVPGLSEAVQHPADAERLVAGPHYADAQHKVVGVDGADGHLQVVGSADADGQPQVAPGASGWQDDSNAALLAAVVCGLPSTSYSTEGTQQQQQQQQTGKDALEPEQRISRSDNSVTGPSTVSIAQLANAQAMMLQEGADHSAAPVLNKLDGIDRYHAAQLPMDLLTHDTDSCPVGASSHHESAEDLAVLDFAAASQQGRDSKLLVSQGAPVIAAAERCAAATPVASDVEGSPRGSTAGVCKQSDLASPSSMDTQGMVDLPSANEEVQATSCIVPADSHEGLADTNTCGDAAADMHAAVMLVGASIRESSAEEGATQDEHDDAWLVDAPSLMDTSTQQQQLQHAAALADELSPGPGVAKHADSVDQLQRHMSQAAQLISSQSEEALHVMQQGTSNVPAEAVVAEHECSLSQQAQVTTGQRQQSEQRIVSLQLTSHEVYEGVPEDDSSLHSSDRGMQQGSTDISRQASGVEGACTAAQQLQPTGQPAEQHKRHAGDQQQVHEQQGCSSDADNSTAADSSAAADNSTAADSSAAADKNTAAGSSTAVDNSAAADTNAAPGARAAGNAVDGADHQQHHERHNHPVTSQSGAVDGVSISLQQVQHASDKALMDKQHGNSMQLIADEASISHMALLQGESSMAYACVLEQQPGQLCVAHAAAEDGSHASLAGAVTDVEHGHVPEQLGLEANAVTNEREQPSVAVSRALDTSPLQGHLPERTEQLGLQPVADGMPVQQPVADMVADLQTDAGSTQHQQQAQRIVDSNGVEGVESHAHYISSCSALEAKQGQQVHGDVTGMCSSPESQQEQAEVAVHDSTSAHGCPPAASVCHEPAEPESVRAGQDSDFLAAETDASLPLVHAGSDNRLASETAEVADGEAPCAAGHQHQPDDLMDADGRPAQQEHVDVPEKDASQQHQDSTVQQLSKAITSGCDHSPSEEPQDAPIDAVYHSQPTEQPCATGGVLPTAIQEAAEKGEHQEIIAEGAADAAGSCETCLSLVGNMASDTQACQPALESTASLEDAAADEHAPADDTADKRSPAEHAAGQHAPAEDAVDQHAPARDAADEHAPVEVAADKHVPAEDAADQHAPARDAACEHAPAEVAADQHARAGDAADQHAPAEDAADQHAPAEDAADKHAPGRDAADKHALADIAADKHAPTEDAVDQHAPARDAADEHAPAKIAADQHAPTREAADQHAPAEDAADQHALTRHAADQHAPARDAADEHAPADIATDEHTPATDAADQHALANDAADEHAPAETAADQHAPATDAADEHAPAEIAAGQHAPANDAADEHAPAEIAADQHAPAEDAADQHALTGHAADQHAAAEDAADQQLSARDASDKEGRASATHNNTSSVMPRNLQPLVVEASAHEAVTNVTDGAITPSDVLAATGTPVTAVTSNWSGSAATPMSAVRPSPLTESGALLFSMEGTIPAAKHTVDTAAGTSAGGDQPGAEIVRCALGFDARQSTGTAYSVDSIATTAAGVRAPSSLPPDAAILLTMGNTGHTGQYAGSSQEAMAAALDTATYSLNVVARTTTSLSNVLAVTSATGPTGPGQAPIVALPVHAHELSFGQDPDSERTSNTGSFNSQQAAPCATDDAVHPVHEQQEDDEHHAEALHAMDSAQVPHAGTSHSQLLPAAADEGDSLSPASQDMETVHHITTNVQRDAGRDAGKKRGGVLELAGQGQVRSIQDGMQTLLRHTADLLADVQMQSQSMEVSPAQPADEALRSQLSSTAVSSLTAEQVYAQRAAELQVVLQSQCRQMQQLSVQLAVLAPSVASEQATGITPNNAIQVELQGLSAGQLTNPAGADSTISHTGVSEGVLMDGDALAGNQRQQQEPASGETQPAASKQGHSLAQQVHSTALQEAAHVDAALKAIGTAQFNLTQGIHRDAASRRESGTGHDILDNLQSISRKPSRNSSHNSNSQAHNSQELHSSTEPPNSKHNRENPHSKTKSGMPCLPDTGVAGGVKGGAGDASSRRTSTEDVTSVTAQRAISGMLLGPGRAFKLGEYQIKQLRNGDVYKGRRVGRCKDGHGIYVFANGDVYEGHFKSDRMDGHGVYTFSHEGRYTGSWSMAAYHGAGCETFARGSMYTGEYASGLRSGWGVCRFFNGDYYEGQWTAGLRHGQGMQQCTDGSNYVGEYQRGKRNGHGVYTFPNGDKYAGEYVDDLPHGYGTYTFATGQKYEGEWRAGRKHGWSTYNVEDGSRWAASWQEGKAIWVEALGALIERVESSGHGPQQHGSSGSEDGSQEGLPGYDAEQLLQLSRDARSAAVQAATHAERSAMEHWAVQGSIQAQLKAALAAAEVAATAAREARRSALELSRRLDVAVGLARNAQLQQQQQLQEQQQQQLQQQQQPEEYPEKKLWVPPSALQQQTAINSHCALASTLVLGLTSSSCELKKG